MKLCANCGATLQDNAVFCISCNCREFKPFVMPDLDAPEPEKKHIEYDQYGRPIGQQYVQPEYEQPHFTEGFPDEISGSFHDPFSDSYSETANHPQYIEQYTQQQQIPQYQQQYGQPQAQQYQQPFGQPQVQQYQQPFGQPQAQQYQQPFEQPQVQQYQQPFEQQQAQQYQQPFEQPQVQQYQQPFEQPQVQQYQQPFEQPQVQQYQQPFEQPQAQQYQQPFEQPQAQQYQQSFEQPQAQKYQQPYEQPQTQQYQQSFEQPQVQQYQQPSEQPQQAEQTNVQKKLLRKDKPKNRPEPENVEQTEQAQEEPPKPVFDSKNFVFEKKETSPDKETEKKQMPKTLKGFIAELQNTRDFTNNYDSRDFAAHKVHCILASLGITFWIPYVACKDSRSSRFYANQGFLIFILEIVFGIIFSLFASIISIGFVDYADEGYRLSLAGWIVGLLVAAIVFAIPIFAIVTSIRNICAGKIKEIPFVGKLRILP